MHKITRIFCHAGHLPPAKHTPSRTFAVANVRATPLKRGCFIANRQERIPDGAGRWIPAFAGMTGIASSVPVISAKSAGTRPKGRATAVIL